MTATTALGPVPAGCRARLTAHYGPAVELWLAAVPAVLSEAASRWCLGELRYHDAGHASVVAVGATGNGPPVLLKTWYDRNRYIRETSALRAWDGHRAIRVLQAADDLATAVVELVDGRPGGGVRPTGEEAAVAEALADLHRAGASLRGRAALVCPTLAEHLDRVVRPRIADRLPRYGVDVPAAYRYALAAITPAADRTALLHADLYRENVLFDDRGRVRFIDPQPLLGDTVFDWAFWTVYYDLYRDPAPRLRLAAETSGIPARELALWCLSLCLDGLLYYREIGDPNAFRMPEVARVFERASQ